MSKNREPVARCGGCGADRELNGVREANPGDGFVCVKCGWIGTFNEAMALEPMTEAQLAALPPIVRLLVLEASKAVKLGELKP